MREIEIKARIDTLSTIRDVLTKKGVRVSEPVTQHDVVWGVPGVTGVAANSSPWLRIRTETKGDTVRHLFTLKRSVTNQLDSIEYETEVNNDKELEGIIRELGFTLYSDLTKTRQKANIDDIEICLDTVDGLGSFIEAEKLVEDTAEYQPVVDSLWGLLDTLGVHRESEVSEGYDVLMNKKLSQK